jgi:hypothetical protein
MTCPNCGKQMREYGAGWECDGERVGDRGCGTWRPKPPRLRLPRLNGDLLLLFL